MIHRSAPVASTSSRSGHSTRLLREVINLFPPLYPCNWLNKQIGVDSAHIIGLPNKSCRLGDIKRFPCGSDGPRNRIVKPLTRNWAKDLLCLCIAATFVACYNLVSALLFSGTVRGFGSCVINQMASATRRLTWIGRASRFDSLHSTLSLSKSDHPHSHVDKFD